MNEFDEMVRSEVSRRAFLTRMSAAGLGAAALSLLAGCGSGSGNSPIINTGVTPTPTPTPGVVYFDSTNFPGIPGRSYNEVVLNYALTLETIESDLYRQALNLASGRAVTTPLDSAIPASGSTGAYNLTVPVGTGIASGFTNAAFLYLVQYAYVEATHRDFLRSAITSAGLAPVAANPKGYTAPFGTTLTSIMSLIYAVEETGVRAYEGAAPYLTDFGLVTTAAAIHSTEARHSSAVAYVLGLDPGPVYALPGVTTGINIVNNTRSTNPAPYSDNTFQFYSTPADVIAAVQGFIVK